MKIAVISDIHENVHNLIQAIEMIEKEKCEVLFCLWDVGRSKLFEIMFMLNIPVYFTFGNHDGNVIKDTKMLLGHKPWGYVRSNGLYQKIKLDGKRMFITHYDELAKIVAKSWEFDVCFGGHEHLTFEESFWNCLCVNPWEITGTRTSTPWFYIYETQTNRWTFYDIENHFEIHTPETIAFYKKMKK